MIGRSLLGPRPCSRWICRLFETFTCVILAWPAHLRALAPFRHAYRSTAQNPKVLKHLAASESFSFLFLFFRFLFPLLFNLVRSPKIFPTVHFSCFSWLSLFGMRDEPVDLLFIYPPIHIVVPKLMRKRDRRAERL